VDVDTFLKTWNRLGEQALPQGVLISGPSYLISGEGREDILSRLISADTSGAFSEKHFRLEPEVDKSQVSVNTIRQLQHQLSLKRDVAFFVVIPQADQLSVAGWNILLKVLEEPPPNVHFIIFSRQQGQVPITVRSRLLNYFISQKGGVHGEDNLPIHETALTMGTYKTFLEKKPTKPEDWDRWVSGLRVHFKKCVSESRWEAAVQIAGVFIEVSDILGRKRRDGSVNLKYHISSVVARYTTT
jgi:hypothetical protein